MQQHVPELAIQVECDAKSTKQNAQFATPILRERQCRNAILVTSWYHSRRAVHCFEHFAPEIHFYSMPSHEHFRRIPRRWQETRYILTEYAKILGYIPRWGILPI
jgi:uncharacterized SAM-binding protein YcdF (DUF218 family)